MSNGRDSSTETVSELLLESAAGLMSLDARMWSRGLTAMPPGYVIAVRAVAEIVRRLSRRQPPPPEVLSLPVDRWLLERLRDVEKRLANLPPSPS